MGRKIRKQGHRRSAAHAPTTQLLPIHEDETLSGSTTTSDVHMVDDLLSSLCGYVEGKISVAALRLHRLYEVHMANHPELMRRLQIFIQPNEISKYKIILILLTTICAFLIQKTLHSLFDRESHYAVNTKDLLFSHSYYQTSNDPNYNAMQPPMGYPFHRWNTKMSSMSGYPLHVDKFVNILHRMGRGEMIKTSLVEGLTAQENYRDFIRLSGASFPYLVQNGKVLRPYGEKNRWKVYKWHTQGQHIDWVTLLESAVLMAKKLEDKNPRMKLITEGEFPIIFDTFDYPWCGDDLVPIFRLSTIVSAEECSHSWSSLSMDYILPQRKQWLKDTSVDWDMQFAQWKLQYPWESKLSMAVWRGRYSGYRDIYDRGVLPREQLVIRASRSPDIMDVLPVSWTYYPDATTGQLLQKSQHQLPFRDFMKYKAIIDIDGNGSSTRFGPLLCMNSVVLKVNPKFGSYWNGELKPWRHYIPVDAELRNLEQQVMHVINERNEKQIQQIIKTANDWCRKKMTWEQHTTDFLWTLLDYAELLDKSARFYDKWTSDYYAYHLPNLEMSQFTGELVI
mmetsp:Transcript_29370/g.61474  ORF Transcript_29370/g.61474 Transcript_29370/m.61474 type:complete len:564 (-) Transcript_29370:112-1803(-)